MSTTVREKPRLPVENTGEQHLACVVLVDTSGSMSGYEKELRNAIAAMKEAIMEDDIARGRVEICLATFDDDVKELSPFSVITRMEIPEISCGGMTCTHTAIKFALDRVAERKAEYHQSHITYNQPWIWLLTDGGSNDNDNGSFAELLRAQREGKCTFFGVAVGEGVNITELAGMHKNGQILRVGRDNLAKVFEFISQSVSVASRRNPGEKTVMQTPEGIEVVTVSNENPDSDGDEPSEGGSSSKKTTPLTQRPRLLFLSKKWAIVVHPLVCLAVVGYMLLSLVIKSKRSFSNGDLGDVIGVALTFSVLRRWLIIMGIGTVFSFVGLFFRKAWAYLTSAIIQSISPIVCMVIVFGDYSILFVTLLMIILGYLAYYQIHKAS